MQSDIPNVNFITGFNDGTHNHAFQGTFDGGHHYITVNIVGTDHRGTGLFGATSEDAVLNHVLVAGNISGTGYTGGIVGDMDGATLNYCANYANISVTAANASCVGGLVGCGD